MKPLTMHMMNDEHVPIPPLTLERKIRFSWISSKQIIDKTIRKMILDEELYRRDCLKMVGNYFDIKMKYVSLGINERRALKSLRILKHREDEKKIDSELTKHQTNFSFVDTNHKERLNAYKSSIVFKSFIFTDEKCLDIWKSVHHALPTGKYTVEVCRDRNTINGYIGKLVEVAMTIAFDDSFLTTNIEKKESMMTMNDVLTKHPTLFSKRGISPSINVIEGTKRDDMFALTAVYLICRRYLRKRYVKPFTLSVAKDAITRLITMLCRVGTLPSALFACGTSLGPEWISIKTEQDADTITDIFKDVKTYASFKIMAFVRIMKRLIVIHRKQNDNNNNNNNNNNDDDDIFSIDTISLYACTTLNTTNDNNTIVVKKKHIKS